MSSVAEVLPRRLFPLPACLVSSPLSLLCLALLANAACQPYLGFFHDSRLYAFYLESGLERQLSVDQDFYLVHGSQVRYSLFSGFVLPEREHFGRSPGMFAVSLLITALLCSRFQ